MVISSKGCKPDNFESHNSLKLSYMSIQDLYLNYVFLWVFPWIMFFASLSLNILAVCETNLDDSIDSGNFSMRGYLLPLIWKDSNTHMQVLKKNFKFFFKNLLLYIWPLIYLFALGRNMLYCLQLFSRNLIL